MTTPNHADMAFASAVVLTKREVFDALEACAGAERALLRSGRAADAAGVASLFELLEDRLVLDPLPRPYGAVAPNPSGSNSSDRELTQ